MYKSSSLRKIKVRTPGGRLNVLYKKRKPKHARCALCGAKLNGVPRERPHKMRNLAKTKKRPERTFGGVLCHKCLKKLILQHIE